MTRKHYIDCQNLSSVIDTLRGILRLPSRPISGQPLGPSSPVPVSVKQKTSNQRTQKSLNPLISNPIEHVEFSSRAVRVISSTGAYWSWQQRSGSHSGGRRRGGHWFAAFAFWDKKSAKGRGACHNPLAIRILPRTASIEGHYGGAAAQPATFDNFARKIREGGMGWGDY